MVRNSSWLFLVILVIFGHSEARRGTQRVAEEKAVDARRRARLVADRKKGGGGTTRLRRVKQAFAAPPWNEQCWSEVRKEVVGRGRLCAGAQRGVTSEQAEGRV